MKLSQSDSALMAIKARIECRLDDEDLLLFGGLRGDIIQDVGFIVTATLAYLEEPA